MGSILVFPLNISKPYKHLSSSEDIVSFYGTGSSQMTVATAVDIYMQSPNCSAAKKAVDAAFGGGSGHIFMRGINGV